jgi:hypothetical protein
MRPNVLHTIISHLSILCDHPKLLGNKTHFMCSNYSPLKIVPFLDNVNMYIVEPGRPEITVRRMRIACWMPKATHTPLHYVILFYFPTVIKVAQTRLNVALIYTLPILLSY